MENLKESEQRIKELENEVTIKTKRIEELEKEVHFSKKYIETLVKELQEFKAKEKSSRFNITGELILELENLMTEKDFSREIILSIDALLKNTDDFFTGIIPMLTQLHEIYFLVSSNEKKFRDETE